jgi:hypothetical protein
MSLDDFSQRPNAEAQERQRAVKLLELFEAGISETPDIIGYHGTSTEALEASLKTGSLPGQTYEDHMHAPGDFFIAPILSNLPSEWLRSHVESEEPIRDAQWYAEDVAMRHYVLHELGIPLDNENAQTAVLRFDEAEDDIRAGGGDLQPSDREFIESVGMERLSSLMERARQRQGVVLSIKRSALEKYGFGVGDKGTLDAPANDAKLQTGPNGLSLDDIGGMKAMGPDGEAFIQRLRNIAG